MEDTADAITPLDAVGTPKFCVGEEIRLNTDVAAETMPLPDWVASGTLGLVFRNEDKADSAALWAEIECKAEESADRATLVGICDAKFGSELAMEARIELTGSNGFGDEIPDAEGVCNTEGNEEGLMGRDETAPFPAVDKVTEPVL